MLFFYGRVHLQVFTRELFDSSRPSYRIFCRLFKDVYSGKTDELRKVELVNERKYNFKEWTSLWAAVQKSENELMLIGFLSREEVCVYSIWRVEAIDRLITSFVAS